MKLACIIREMTLQIYHCKDVIVNKRMVKTGQGWTHNVGTCTQPQQWGGAKWKPTCTMMQMWRND